MAKTVLDRRSALAGGWPRYFTGEACKNGHIADRQTMSGACVECLKEAKQRELGRYQEAKLARQS